MAIATTRILWFLLTFVPQSAILRFLLTISRSPVSTFFSADVVPLGRFKKSMTPTRSVLELSRDEAKAIVQETIAIVDRLYDSDDWKPCSPPSSEDEVRQRADPDAMHPEIAANEEKHRLSQIATTVHPRASVSLPANSGRA